MRRAVALAAGAPALAEETTPTLSAAARELGVSPNHLNGLLKEQTGLTFRQLLIQQRMEMAKTLLRFGHESCTDIAMACGFSDSNYFARLFRHKVGVSPTAFRQKAP